MSSLTIWHNPRCSKSRQTLALLQEKGHTPFITLYLDDAPDIATLKEVGAKLGRTAAQMIRTGEGVYKQLALKGASEASLFKAMAANPILIERPIVIHGEKAEIGRPPEAVLAILQDQRDCS